jgi:hypothetical protein
MRTIQKFNWNIILDERINLMILWANFQKKKESKKEFIDILFHLSNWIIILNQFLSTSSY